MTRLLAWALCFTASFSMAQEATEPAQPAPAPAEQPVVTPSETPAVPVKPPETPWELRPYTVHIPITFDANSFLSEATRKAFVASLQQRLTDDLGAMWELTVREADADEQMDARAIGALSSEKAKTLWAAPVDKSYPLSVSRGNDSFSFTTREWDATSWQLGPVQQGSSPDARLAAPNAASIVRLAFRSLVQVDAVEGKSVVLRIRAGELLPPDSTAAQLVNGDLLVPFYRQLDKKKEVRRIQTVPWTLLRADAVDRARVEAVGVSTFPVPVVPSKRRMESLALEVRPQYPSTELQVVPRNNPGNPIAAARVDIMDRLPTAEDPVLDRLELRTNRQGIVVVPADATPQVRYAIVNSGKAILARVPFCPGVERSLALEVFDDIPRLSVEGEVSLLEADLIELVARRKILALRIEALAKEDKAEKARALVDQLRVLPDQKAFQQRIDLVLTAGVEAARAKKDPLGEGRIRKLCKTLTDVAREHLDQEKFQQTLIDLEETVRSGVSVRKS